MVGFACSRNVKSLVGELSFDLHVRDAAESERLMSGAEAQED